jgi:CDP-diacylglycerol--glycerol-3-phosphate 3-phosphatidyltransferase
MNGLYVLKPWYAGRLAGIRDRLAARAVPPHAVTVAGVVAGAAAGLALAVLPAGVAALAVVPLLAARLGAANLDGGLARQTGRCTPWGAVVNELGDRLADVAMLAGFLALAPAGWVCAALFAATLPSWVALAGAAAGAARVSGGPVGKTERCLLVAVAAVAGHPVPVLAVLAAGSVLTAGVRLAAVYRGLR